LIVPFGATAGAELRPGRCEPQITGVGTALGLGGQGKAAVSKTPGHWSFPCGAPWVNEAKVAVRNVLFDSTFTSHEFTTSTSHSRWRSSFRTL